MSHLDNLFREGLGDRRPDVPQDLWQKIAARKSDIPAGEQLDRLFADKLGERQAVVPPGMWERIIATRRTFAYRTYAAALLLLLLTAGGLTYYLTWTGTQEQAATLPFPATFPVNVPDDRPLKSANENKTAAPGEAQQLPATNLNAKPAVPVKQQATPYTATSTPVLKQRKRMVAVISVIDVLPIDLLPTWPVVPETGPVNPNENNSFRGSGRRRLQLEGLAGAAYANQSFSLREAGSQPLRAVREVSEFPEVSFQLSARLRYRLRNSFHLVTGLTYAELRNRFEYERAGPGGQELMHNSNRIRMVEVPVLASYQLPGRRFHLSVNAGPLINLTTQVRGKFLDPDVATPRDLADAGDYRKNVGLGWAASLTTTYLVGKERTTQLLLEPFFKHYPTSFTLPDAELSERYWVAGLQVGLRRQFR